MRDATEIQRDWALFLDLDGTLLDIAERFRGEFVLLPMSRQDMADYLGLTIETISRMLGRLQADGVIELSGSRKCRIRRLAFLSELAAG